MRKFFLALVVAAVVLPWQSVSAAPGQVTKADPQLFQTFWTTLAVRDGVRERDEVRIERHGQTVAEGLVVSVTADHSVVMLKGKSPNPTQAGDYVTVVKQAAALPTTTAAPVAHPAAAQVASYKVVGGHAMITFSAAASFGGSGGFGGSDINVGSLSVSSGFSTSGSLSFGGGISIGGPSFGGDLHFGGF